MTYLESYWELEGILADLGFSARGIFFHHFLSTNICSEKSYRGSKYFSFELRCRKNFERIDRFFENFPNFRNLVKRNIENFLSRKFSMIFFYNIWEILEKKSIYSFEIFVYFFLHLNSKEKYFEPR